MAASPVQLDFGSTIPALTNGLPPIRGIQALPLPEVWCGKSQASCEEEGMHPQELQECLWQQFFSDPTEWWDNRRSQPTLQLPAWVSGMKRAPESGSAAAQEQVAVGRLASIEGQHLEVGMCRKLCEEGRITDAVDALDLVVQRGCHVPNNLFYRVLKGCIADKDLVLGRRVHALTVRSGYEGDAFLATHLIGLYASHGRLEEAMGVFTKVSAPSAYNWATIIFAYARHGEAALAMRLYRQMQESAVKPDNRIYSAVLKACATAGDLVAGKEVHAHILASPGKPDVFVQTGLLYMYAKCRSLEDARRVFDRLSDKNVVTWNAMLAGYAQQGMGQEAVSLYRSMRLEGITAPDSVTFLCLLQACASVGGGALHQGKELEAQIAERRLHDDVVLGGSLVNMYAKCGSIEDARRVFDRLPERNVVTWTVMIGGYAQQGMMGGEALSLYRSMLQEGITPPDCVTFACLLQACASVGVGALHEGKQIHAQIEELGLEGDVVLGGSLVNMYAKCGSLEDARIVFDGLGERNVVTWTAMMAGYTQQGMGGEALSLYASMQEEGLTPPGSVTFVCLLQACATMGEGAVHQGKQLHAQTEECGLQDDVVVGGSLVNMYAKCGSLEDARSVFARLPYRNVVTWNAMLAGCVQQGMDQEALTVYGSMQQEGITAPDSFTFTCLLQACGSAATLPLGKQLHAQIEERGLQADAVVGTCLIDMYAKCGSLEDARCVFDRFPHRNVATWNAMLAGYAQHGMGEEALALYTSMQHEGIVPPDSVTFVCLLQACASVGGGALHQGKQLHAQIAEQGLQDDVVLGGSLVNMYAKCGSIEDARRVFDRLPSRNVVTWTAMFAGYAQQGMGVEALGLYHGMQQEDQSPPDSVTFVCLLQACASVGVGALEQGKQLHAQTEARGLQDDVVVGGSLVNMYAKCGSLEDARRLFDRLPARNVVTWNAMLAGYVQQGMGEEALTLYTSMQQEDATPPDSATFVCLLEACASLAALPLGKQLHAQIEERGLQADAVVGAALVNMYAKCGSMVDSQQVFDSLPERSIEAWGALTGGYTRRGDSEVVFALLHRMRAEGIQPDGITFLSVLTVCSHVGLVDKGRKYFDAMRTDYGISPSIEHYTCMVDLLGRAGHLDEALRMAKTMPFSPNRVVWLTLLGACQKWNNVDIGQQAFESAVSVDGKVEKHAASYVLMSNIYATAQMWEKAKEMQDRRRAKCGAWKKPGQSWWTDMGGVVHTFGVGDKKHPEIEAIYERLEQLVPKLMKQGTDDAS